MTAVDPRARRPRPRRAGRPPRAAAPQDGGAARRRARRSPRWSRAHDAFEHAGGYAAESEARSVLAGLGLTARPRRPPDRRPVRRRAAPGRARPHPLRRHRPAAARRADQPPRQRRPRLAARLPPQLPGRRSSWSATTSSCSTNRSPACCTSTGPARPTSASSTEYKGTYSQYRHARERRRGPAGQAVAARQQAEIARLQTLVDRWGAKASKASFAHSLETRIARIQPDGVDAPDGAGGACGCACPTRRRRAAPSLEVGGLAKSYGGGPPVFEDSRSTSGGASGSWCSGSTGPARPRCCGSWPGVTEADAGDVDWGHQSRSATTPRSTRASAAGASLLDPHDGGGARARRRRCGAGCSACSACRATRSHQDAGDAVGRREDRSWPSPCWSRAATTCCCSTSRPTTSTRRRGRPWPRRWRAGAGRW